MKNNLEIERKFLLNNKLDINELLGEAIELHSIEQSYIYNKNNIEERVRQSLIEKYVDKDNNPLNLKEFNDIQDSSIIWKTVFSFTHKEGTGQVRIEEEEKISNYIYKYLIKNKIGNTIIKKRYKLPNTDIQKYNEIIIDYYPSINLYVSEIEYKEEKYLNSPIPNPLKKFILRDISNEKKYANKYMALNKINISDYQ